MEFDNLGKKCSFIECGRQDYLPFFCEFCKKYYCLEHRTIDKHKCPIDNKIINIKKTKSVFYKCELCKEKQLFELKCSKCNKHVCLKHRYQDKHHCVKNKYYSIKRPSKKKCIIM